MENIQLSIHDLKQQQNHKQKRLVHLLMLQDYYRKRVRERERVLFKRDVKLSIQNLFLRFYI